MKSWKKIGAGAFLAAGLAAGGTVPIVPVTDGYYVRHVPTSEGQFDTTSKGENVSKLKRARVIGDACYNEFRAEGKKTIRERTNCAEYDKAGTVRGWKSPKLEGYEWVGYKTLLFDTPSGDLEPGYYADTKERWVTPLEAIAEKAQAIEATTVTAKVNAGNVSSYSFNHTVSTGDVLYVTQGNGNEASNLSSITFNSVSLSSVIGSTAGSNDANIRFLATPDVGTYSVTVTLSGTASFNHAGAISLSGTDGAAPTVTGSNTSLSLNITTDTLGDWVIDSQNNNSNITNTIGAGQTVIYNANGTTANGEASGSYEEGGAPGTVTMSWTNANANTIVHVAARVEWQACDPTVSTCIDKFRTAGYNQWTAPTGVTEADVACWGGGGAGFDGNSTGGGAGGGGGAFASSTIAVTPGTSYTIFIGSGGATSGANGTDSTFATTTVVADGGSGGTGAVTSGGAGGTTANSTGDVEAAGGAGGNGIDNSTHDGGGGGGGAGGPHGTGNAGTAGQASTGGAGGAGDNGSGGTAGTAVNGQAGGPGGLGLKTGGGGGGGGDNGTAGGAGGAPGGGGGGGETLFGSGANGQCSVTYVGSAAPPAAASPNANPVIWYTED